MKSFRITNMKSFVDSGAIEVRPITIFVGKNSCGKSSLLRFPAVLGQTIQSETNNPISFYGKFVDYGTFESVMHRGDSPEEKTLVYDISYMIKDLFISIDDMISTDPLIVRQRNYAIGKTGTIRVEIDKCARQLIVKSLEVYLDDVLISSLIKSETNDKKYNYCVHINLTPEGIESRPITVAIEVDEFTGFIPDFSDLKRYVLNRGSSTINKDCFETGVEITEADLKNQMSFALRIMKSLVSALGSEAQNMSYIGPFRENPQRIYRDTESSSAEYVGSKGENLSTILLRESESDSEVIRAISKWLRENYGYSLAIEPAIGGYFNIMLVDDKGIKSNLMDVGYGISQVLPIITQLIRNIVEPEMRCFFMIEQPELHLHPAAQANLADLFVRTVDNLKHTVMIETHSEHLIRKLQVLIAEGKIPAEDIAVYSVEKDESGAAFVHRMPLNSEGRFTAKWPSGFFDKSHELASALRAANRTEE